MQAMNAVDVGNVVRRRRLRGGLTQAQLARNIGVSRKWVADLEKGHPRAQLQLVLDALNALDALVDIVDSPGSNPRLGLDAQRSPSALQADLRELSGTRAVPGVPHRLSTLPKVSLSHELVETLARLAEQVKLPRDVAQSLDSIRRVHAIDPSQMAAIRNTIAHAGVDDSTRRAIRDISKALARVESQQSWRPHEAIESSYAKLDGRAEDRQ